jgi:3D (Asp-Asp-Asp) domain-containing protein
LAIIVVAVVTFLVAPPLTVIAPQTVSSLKFTLPMPILQPAKPAPTPQPTIYTVTAYTAGPESTGKRRGDRDFGITAAGTTVRDGYTIACGPSLPFGTVVVIDGIGARTCADRGGAITDGRLDVFISDLSVARKFGRRRLRITILPMGSGYVE